MAEGPSRKCRGLNSAIGAIRCSAGGYEKIGLPQGHGPHLPADHNNLWLVRLESSFILSFWKVFGTGGPVTSEEPPRSSNFSNYISELTIICWARNGESSKKPRCDGPNCLTPQWLTAIPPRVGRRPRS